MNRSDYRLSAAKLAMFMDIIETMKYREQCDPQRLLYHDSDDQNIYLVKDRVAIEHSETFLLKHSKKRKSRHGD